MTETVDMRFLADVLQTIPTLASWYKDEWCEWFADMPLAELEADFSTVAQRDRLPFALVALDPGAEPVGVCSVRAEVFAPYPYAGPWLRGLYVLPSHRGQGIAGELIRAAGKHAATLGVVKLYAATHSACGTFERAGWLGFDQAPQPPETLTIFARRFL
jgi:GNAT superfamily N-acetyltransferase